MPRRVPEKILTHDALFATTVSNKRWHDSEMYYSLEDNKMKFELLADSIKRINDKAGNAAKSAVNQLMTLRNWVIGYYIVEYEQEGSDRAEYGAHLLKNLEKEII